MTANTNLTVDARAARSRIWHILGALGASIAVILVVGIGWFLSIARSALPELDGTLSVSGVAAPVSITRDGHGVPTIEAAAMDDLFFAQGYTTAQDRLFQMDLMRRAATGELAEIVGDIAIEHDRRQRVLGIRATAEKGLQSATDDDRKQFSAYARGVNAFIGSHRDRLPLEFRILGYKPRPWTMQDSLAIAYQMVQTLSISPADTITREKVLAKLGPQPTADLYVNTSWRDHPPTQATPALDAAPPAQSSVPGSVARMSATRHILASWVQPLLEDEPFRPGSNNWVVSGAHTTTGKPLLSNDMHLGHQMPNLWYEAHLKSGSLDAVGVTLPGYPYVIVGHNQRVAWGFTNVGPTVEDLYIENFNESGEYLTADGWKKPEVRPEVIHIKGKPDVALNVALTRHGPIVSDLYPGEIRKLALRWTLYDGIRNPFYRVDLAKNWQEFRDAFSDFDAPGQNVVYADVDGNIGYQATGKIPIRASGDGSLPADGSNNAHEWTGYIPYDRMPSVLNPPSGIIGTANGRITPDGYGYSISAEWEAPYRTDRIYRVLSSGKKFSASDMLALQTDIYSDLDHFVADKLVYAIDHAKSPSAQAHKAADLLRQWNGQVSADSAAATITAKTRVELKRLILEPKLGPASDDDEQNRSHLSWKSYTWQLQTIWLENILTHQPPQWLPSGYSDYNELLTAGVEAALKQAPADLNSWKWGPQNSVTIQNPILGKIPILRRWTGPGEQKQSGSGFTVKASGRSYGPSERFTADLSNLDASNLNIVTGQSGNFLSPYYMDQWRAWYTGYTFTLPFSKSAVENSATHRLLLVPK
jgi:penicillin G amidase